MIDDKRLYYQNRVRAAHILLDLQIAPGTTSQLQLRLRDHRADGFCEIPGCSTVEWWSLSMAMIYQSLIRLERLGCVTRLRYATAAHIWSKTGKDYWEPLVRPSDWDTEKVRATLFALRDRLNAGAQTA